MKRKINFIFLFLIALIIYFLINLKWHIYIPCIFHELTGLYCPGCGITRMFFALLKLDFINAFHYNPLVFIMLLGYIFYKVISLRTPVKLPKYFSLILLVIVVLFGVLRNIDTFSFLRPQ